MFFDMSAKTFLVTPPPPTILGENINVQFACSGNFSNLRLTDKTFFLANTPGLIQTLTKVHALQPYFGCKSDGL
jgi:hypothetical protein